MVQLLIVVDNILSEPAVRQDCQGPNKARLPEEASDRLRACGDACVHAIWAV